MKRRLRFAVLVLIFSVGNGGWTMTFSISSKTFHDGGTIPTKHTCDGEDLSPALAWSGLPNGTKSLALIVDDPDAPVGTWVHWVVYDIPVSASGFEEGLAKNETLENGAKQGLSWGVKQFSKLGYGGPCPPPGGPHRYLFKLYALDRMLGLPPRKTKFDLEQAMSGHTLATAQLIGIYGR